MGEFSVNIAGCREAAESLSDNSELLEKIAEEIAQVSRELTEQQESMIQMRTRLRNISESVYQQHEKTGKIKEALNSCLNIYEKTEMDICSKKSIEKNVENTENDIQNNTRNVDIGKILGFSGDEEGIKKLIEKMLKINEESNPESKMSKELLAYITSLNDFYSGDKKGTTGVADLAELGSDSADLWSKFYEYLKDQDAIGELEKKFGTTAGIVGILGAISGTIGKAAGVFDTEGKTTGQLISAWGDTATEGVGILEELDGALGGKKMAGGGYFTLGKTTLATFSELLESYSEYTADGELSGNDVGAIGIDASIKGLTELARDVTGGIVDIDAEYTAEVVKDWASDWGTRAGNYILDNPELKEQYMNGNGFQRFGLTIQSIWTTAFGG